MIQYQIVGERKRPNNFYLICFLILGLCLLSFSLVYVAAHFDSIFPENTQILFSDKEISSSFEEFIVAYEKVYSSEEEKRERKAIFAENYVKIKEFNMKKDRTFTLGINKFADLTDDEFKIQYLTENPVPSVIAAKENEEAKYEGDSIVEDIDWVTDKLVAPIKDQGNCGSCWTFGSISTIESRYAKVEGKLIVFSEQQLVDCCVTQDSKGCSGGNVEDALPYVNKTGIAGITEYPYVARDEICRVKDMKKLYNAVDGFATVPPQNQMEMQKALLNHTMYVSVNAGAFNFRFYKSGIISEGCPGNTLGHGVTLVGSGTSKEGVKYWRIRNSWGKNWGDKGYVYFLRDLEDKGFGMCGVARHVVHPLYKEK